MRSKTCTKMIFTIQLICFLVVFLPNAALAENYDGLQAEILQLQQVNSDLEAEIEQLKQQMLQIVEAMKTWQTPKNDSDLEGRVVDLEESMAEVQDSMAEVQEDIDLLTDEIDDVESVNILQDQKLNIIEINVSDNEDDIEALVQNVDTLEDSVSVTQNQIFELEDDVSGLDLRVSDLESGGGGTNDTDLTERVETLEEVTSELETENDQQDERISSAESDIGDLDARVGDLEAGSGGGGNWNDTAIRDSIFLVALSSTDDHGAPLRFDREIINPGGHYNSTTGEYTVPYDGIYQFSVNLQYEGGYIVVYVFVDGSGVGQHEDHFTNPSTESRSITFIQQLTTGQTVHIAQYSGAGGVYGCPDNLCSYFSGHLISAD